MQSRHCAACHLRDPSNVRVCWFSIRTSEAHKTVTLLARFRRREWLAKFPGNCGGNRATANWNASRENFCRLDKEKICRARSDIHEQGAATQIAIIVAERVIERHGRDIDDRCVQPRLLNRTVDLIEQVNFNRNQYNLNWFAAPASHKLVIPNDLVDWERNILLRLERNDSLDLFFVNRRKFDKTREN